MTVDVQELLAREEIRQVLADYARQADRRDWEAVRACYHDDAVDDHGVCKGPIDEVIAHLRRYVDYDGTTHVLGPSTFWFDGPERADVETPALAHHWWRPGSDRAEMLMCARYVDRFERRNGAWRIAKRTVAVEWARELPAPAADWEHLHRFQLTAGADAARRSSGR